MSYIAIDPRFFQKTGDLSSLQHIIIGSEQGVQGAINYLHLLRYAERLEWSGLFTIPESGMVIRPEPGEVFSYLLRYQQPG